MIILAPIALIFIASFLLTRHYYVRAGESVLSKSYAKGQRRNAFSTLSSFALCAFACPILNQLLRLHDFREACWGHGSSELNTSG